MNPKAICADMAFHHPHNMQAFCRMHNIKRFPSGPHTPWPYRAEMGVRLLEKFLSALVDTASKNLDKTTLSPITIAQLMRKAARMRNTQVTLKWQKNADGVSHVKKTKRSHGPIYHESRTADIYTNHTGHPESGDSKKLAMKTHLEVQQREDIRRDLAERMKSVPPDLRAVEQVFFLWQDDPSKTQQGRKSAK